MKNLRLALGSSALTVCLAAAGMHVLAQQQNTMAAANDDPANLKGEQVQPLRGDEIPENTGTKALWQNLIKLKTRASLLMIVAHPDDEDGGMLTYEVRGQGARAAMLTLTRGEGGQNLMSADFNDALGLVRTEELLAADQYSGIQQMFGTEADFGFCKAREEALAKWTHERVLYDAVRAVRLFRPLVVTSVFVGGPTDGHGHHQVAGEMAQEVFNAAADPKVFPEMGLPVWAPLKVYSRAPSVGLQGQQIYDSATGKYVPLRFFNYITQTWSDQVPGVNVVIHEGEVAPKLGMSYVQFAREGLGLQKTQIGDGVRRGGTGGAFDVRYHRWASRVPAQDMEQSFFDGVDVSLAGIATLAPEERTFLPQGLAKLQDLADKAVAGYSEAIPEKIAPVVKDALVTVRDLITRIETSKLSATEKYNLLHELRAKEVQANDALVEAVGLKVEASENYPFPTPINADGRSIQAQWAIFTVTPGTGYSMNFRATATAPVAHMQARVTASTGSVLSSWDCEAGCGESSLRQIPVPSDMPATRPYFTRKDIEQPYYEVHDANLRNAPRTPAPLTAWVTADYDGVTVRTGALLRSVVGPKREMAPVKIVPLVSVKLTQAGGIVLPQAKSIGVDVEVHANRAGSLRLALPAGWTASPSNASFRDSAEMHFDVTPGKLDAAPVTLTAIATVDGKEYTDGYRGGGYDASTDVNVYSPATYTTRAADVKVSPGLKVGYLMGTGDDVPEYLKQIGVVPVFLQGNSLTATALKGLDVVLLGVRPFASHRDIGQAGQALMEFVRDGGTLILQYDTIPVPDGLLPYPLSPGGNPGGVVVDEVSKVILTPGASQVMRWPNQITEKDFEGWVEERGHGFAQNFDPRYEAPTETHDPGQDPQRGGLLIADYGKGHYVYCAFALYRQLPESVPGAYRLFANMLSLGKAPAGK